jgi:flagellin
MSMSSIVLSASVRQNLLSLQSTASLLATTQNDLATGDKVNSALDNPTSFFTASALNDRASDISNLLDGIGNGVQVLQAANTGITSLQGLVASAQSIANQVLQTPIGYTTKSSVTSVAINGATANNLLGSASAGTDATFTSTAAGTATITAATDAAANTETGTVALTGGGAPATANTVLGTATGDLDLSALANDTFTVGTETIQFSATATTTDSTTTPNTTVIGVGANSTSTLQDLLTALQAGSGGGTASVDNNGNINLATTTTGGDFTFGGADSAAVLAALGISNVTHTAASDPTSGNITANTALSGTPPANGSGVLSSAFAVGDTITVDNKTLTFSAGATDTTANGGTISTSGTVQDILDAIDKITGSTGANAASITGGKITLHTGTASNLTISSTNTGALAALGLGTGGVNQALTPGSSGLSGQTLTIEATTGGTATNITFGTGTGQVSTLNDLNTALAANNLQATIDSDGDLTISTTNNGASSTIGAVGGTATATGAAFAGVTAGGQPPVADPNAQATRAGLVSQYNNILTQINTTSQDSSFNGINLLEGDTLNLTFDETGKSTLAIKGVTFNTTALGLSNLAAGTDFLDSNSANAVLTSLTQVSSTLRSEASNLGSNLSIVQIRQDFSKNMINVLQTGASNLTLADTNEEAANSQALSTRQSIAVSALALANQSQQSVLQLLR